VQECRWSWRTSTAAAFVRRGRPTGTAGGIGAGNEQTAERSILTLAQVFELADLVGRRPVRNVRKIAPDAFRLRYREPDGEMCTSPVTYRTKAAALGALWLLASEEQVYLEYDRRFRALVLLATFASLRWGEVIALRRSDLDLVARTVRVREQLVELDGGYMVLGPPKSRAGKRVVGIPAFIVPELAEHLDAFVEDRPDAFVFLGAGGGFLRGGNFRREANWGQALADMGLSALHSTISDTRGTRSPRRVGQVSPISRHGWATTVTGRR
jgi:integrase